jgi:hypothetical protein
MSKDLFQFLERYSYQLTGKQSEFQKQSMADAARNVAQQVGKVANVAHQVHDRHLARMRHASAVEGQLLSGATQNAAHGVNTDGGLSAFAFVSDPWRGLGHHFPSAPKKAGITHAVPNSQLHVGAEAHAIEYVLVMLVIYGLLETQRHHFEGVDAAARDGQQRMALLHHNVKQIRQAVMSIVANAHPPSPDIFIAELKNRAPKEFWALLDKMGPPSRSK